MSFEAFPKIPRLNRDCVVTEKIDGTNAQVFIVSQDEAAGSGNDFEATYGVPMVYWNRHAVYAGSRKRYITPESDNYGFARFVYEHVDAFVTLLGAGKHYGEWWGSGIQRGYGLTGGDKFFSLFNVARWSSLSELPYRVGVVPVLYQGPFHTAAIQAEISYLNTFGSRAAPGYRNPEGVIVWHSAARQLFKVTCENDEKPKGSNE